MIRKETAEDLPEVEKIYARARAYMKETGNPNQWKDSHPSMELVRGDIADGTGYVAFDEDGIYGVFRFAVEEDPTYLKIDGAWLNDEPYGVIHRIAASGRRKGLLREVCEFADGFAPDIRIDTHADNAVMHHLLKKLGFTRCGVIYLANGEPRIAYQRARKPEKA